MRLQSRFAIVCVAAALCLVFAAAPAVAQTTITTSTTVSGTVSYAGLTVGGVSPGPTLTINAPAAITVTAPPGFVVGSNANPYATVIQNGGSVVLSSTANSQLYLGLNTGTGNTIYTGSASYTLNAGTITLGGTAATAGILGIGRSSDATFTQNGGLITAYRNDTVLFIGSGGNGSSYTLTSGTFEGIGTTGPTNGGLGIASNANVSSSGTLTINGAGATVAVQPGNANLTTNGGTATVNLLNGTLALNGEVTRGTPNSGRTPGTVSFTLGGGTLRPYSTNLVVGSSTAANTAAFDITLAANSLSTITGVGWRSGTSTVTIVSNVVGSGSIQFTGGTVVLSGSNTYSGATAVNSGTLAIGAGGTTGSITGNVANNATVVFNRSNSITYSGTISGSGDILKQGAGQLTLSASNSFTGNTTVNSGTLLLGNQNALRGSTFAGGAGTLAFTSVSSEPTANFYYLGGLSGSSSLSLLDTSGTSIRLNFGFNNADTTFSGNLTNGQGIEKYGTGTTTLSGNISTGAAFGQMSTAQGGLRQNGGTITLNRNNGSGAFTVGVGSGTTGSYVLQSGTLLVASTLGHVRLGANGGTGILTIDGGSARAFFSGTNNTIGGNDLNATSGTGTINLIAGELAVNSLTTGTVAGSTGNFNFAGGTLRPYSQNASIGRIGSGFSIALADSSATFSGLDAAAGTARTLTVLTALVDGTAGAAGAIFSGGTISLSAANTYSGATTIAGANSTLALGANGSFATSPTITVGNAGSSGAILDLTAKTGTFTFTSGQTVGGIGTIKMDAGDTAQFAGTFAPGNSPGILTFDGGTGLLSGTTQIEIFGAARGAGYDAVDLINAATLNYGNGVLALDFGSWLADQQSYQLFGSGSSTLLGHFANVTIAGANYAGLTFIVSNGVWTSQGTSPANQTLTFTEATGTLVIVPEPGAIALAGIGIAAAAWGSRRRR